MLSLYALSAVGDCGQVCAYYNSFAVKSEGESMGNLSSALQQLRAERKQAQLHVEKLDQAISVIESLNGSGTFGHSSRRG